MKRVFTLLTLICCAIGIGWAQSTTIGLTQALVESDKTVETKTFTGMDNVTVTKVFGANIKDIENDSKARSISFNGTAYNAQKSCWRKGVKDKYDGQNIGYKLTVADGYALSLSKINAQIAVGDDTYTWYVEILDATGKQIYKSKEKTTKKASSTELSEALSLDGLTGTPEVRLWVKQGGTSKYFVITKLTVEATVAADTRTTYTVTTSCEPATAGTVAPSGTQSFVEGSDVPLTATANTGYKFVKWTINGTDYTDNPYTIAAISENHEAVAHFEALPKISFSKGDDAAVKGDLPAVDYAEKGSTYTIPTAYHLTKDGYTLTGWNDGTSELALNGNITIDGDITLTPIFTANEAALGDEEATVVWPLAQNSDAPNFSYEGNTGYYVKQTTINGKSIDVPMFIDATNGKFNCSADMTRTQMNSGTKLTIPAVKGMTVTVSCTNGTGTTTALSFNGANATTVSQDKKTITYTYDGTENELTIVDNGKNLYPNKISVTYPKTTNSYTLATEDTDFYGLYLDYAATIPAGVTAYTGALSDDESTLTVTEIDGDVLPANCAVLVKAANIGEYKFEASDATADGITSVLKGVTANTDVTALAETGKVVLTLGLKDGVVGFRKPAHDYITANKVYLLVNEASAAKGVKIAFGGDTTGISDINATETEANAPVYNLAGQRVGNGTKGLLIKNGRKFINK